MSDKHDSLHRMSDDKRGSLIKHVQQLTLEARRDMLLAIIGRSEGASAKQLPELAYAYALVTGARPGILPGGSQPESS